MGKMKIGVRLILGFTVVLVLMAIVAGYGTYALSVVAGDVKKMMKNDVAVEGYSREITRNVEAFSLTAYSMGTSRNDGNYQHHKETLPTFTRRIDHYTKLVDEVSPIMKHEEKALWEAAKQERVKFRAHVAETIRLRDAGEKDKALEYAAKTILPGREAYLAGYEKFTHYQTMLSKQATEGVEAAYLTGRTIMLSLAVVAIVLGLLIAWRLTKGITAPLNEAVSVARSVAEGDLTRRIEVKSTDETGQLMQALQDMNRSLFATVSNVRASADTIATASAEIAAGTMDLSSRTEEQASSLQETASSMEELTSTVRQNGDNAKQANQLASQSAEIAVQGGEAARKVADTMSEIDASANKVVDIISVIDGIAFQTNILALNAAVEAARAGEQGRGFAVVATEVRSLAQRSATAAREIKDLIGDSVNRIRTGSELVQQSTVTMLEVGESIRYVNDIMSEISAATQEQVTGIEQVNQAVSRMDTVSQQNAALVEQSAAASESLQDQARTLVQAVGVFKTGTTAPLAPPPSGDAPQSAGGSTVKKLAGSSPARPTAKRSASAAVKPESPVIPPERSAADGDWEEF